MLNNKKIWQTLAIIAFVIVGCTFLSRTLTSSNTLYEYAQKNPELAYGTEAATEENSTQNENSTENPLPETEDTSLPPTKVSTESATEAASLPPPDRFVYADGFFYEPITSEIESRIRGISYPEEDSALAVSLNDLVYVGVLYNDFNGNVANGELICNHSIAMDLLEIFEELYRNNYQFEEISLIDKYNGDDTLSMEHNNTSCFNYRIVDGTDHLSKHAYGLAIDINPFYNPYVVFNKDGSGETYISPEGSEVYADRTKDFPYKIDENDLCYKLFIEHGFTWGGNWNSSKDYQHFQKVK